MTEPPVATRVVLRPLATPLPLGFLALTLATTVFAALQLGWIPPAEGHVAALTAVAATVPLQLTASVMGFLARDPVAATGMGVLAGTWAVVGLALAVPAATAAPAKLGPAAVMGLSGLRFLATGAYQWTGASAWKATAGWVGLALALVALYVALALELEGTRGRTVLPVGRRGAGRAAMDGDAPLEPGALAGEAGVRPQL